jgi:hypothetical protein
MCGSVIWIIQADEDWLTVSGGAATGTVDVS